VTMTQKKEGKMSLTQKPNYRSGPWQRDHSLGYSFPKADLRTIGSILRRYQANNSVVTIPGSFAGHP
jgi:hypothetical protein